jgi:hypothetical protein
VGVTRIGPTRPDPGWSRGEIRARLGLDWIHVDRNDVPWEDSMTDHEGLGRRTFLKQMATVAGSARLAPALIGGAAASLDATA